MRKSFQLFRCVENNPKHRFDVLNVICFAAIGGLKGKRADGFQAALNGL
jgi:hypothetical protein